MTRLHTVRCFGMDARREAVFRMAFKMYKGKSYQLLDMDGEETPDIHIVDIDSMDGREIYAMLQQQQPPPIVLLTGMESPQSVFAFLQKPVRMENLFTILDKLASGSFSPPKIQDEHKISDDKNFSTENKHIVSIERERHLQPVKPESVVESITTESTVKISPPEITVPRKKTAIRPEDVRYFDSDNGLLGLMQRAWRDQTISIIIDEQRNPCMRLDPVSNLVYLRVDDAIWQSACQNDHCSWQMRSPQENEHFNGNQSFSFEWAIWQTALWTTQGRVSRKIPLHTQIRLKRWPNLTRLPETIESLRLSAFLSRSPASPVLVMQMLGVEFAHVFNFIAAADSLGLLHYQKSGDAPNVVVPLEKNTVQVPISAEKRGFLGRILKRIVGL